MKPNDETLYNGQNEVNEEQPQVENNKKKTSWATIGLGSATGILMGAGAIYAASPQSAEEIEQNQEMGEKAEEATIQDKEKDLVENAASSTVSQDAKVATTHHVVAHHVHVAEVTPGLSFSEAFEEARAEVGPGGLFNWNGGIYSTYTKAEWDSMSYAEKQQFASKVNPEISVSDINIAEITEVNPQIVINVDELHIHQGEEEEVISYLGSEDTSIDGKDVTIDHYIVDGHQAAVIDYANENEHDIVIVDKNDNLNVDDGEAMDIVTGDVLNSDLTPMTTSDEDIPDVIDQTFDL